MSWAYRGSHDDVVLVVSELITNALLHGLGSPALRLSGTRERVRIEVGDDSSVLPAQRPAGETGGWGLRVVARLAGSSRCCRGPAASSEPSCCLTSRPPREASTVSRPTPDRPDQDEEFLSRLVSEAGDPTVEPRPEHVADLRARILDRLGPPRTDRRSDGVAAGDPGPGGRLLAGRPRLASRRRQGPGRGPSRTAIGGRDRRPTAAGLRRRRRLVGCPTGPRCVPTARIFLAASGIVAPLDLDPDSSRPARLKPRIRPL